MFVPRKILLVENEEIFREGIKRVINATDGMVADEASAGQELLQKVQGQHYDLVIFDISITGRSGLDIVMDLKRIRPKLPVLVLSGYPEDHFAPRALKSGASGYLPKESSASELLEAVQTILSGRTYEKPSRAEAPVTGKGGPTESGKALSNREFQVMCLIASGKTVGRIAAELSLSVKTVSTYRSYVLRKLNLLNNSDLTRFAIENNLV
jgi:DNA-binding NarL/FixJ family response regulator